MRKVAGVLFFLVIVCLIAGLCPRLLIGRRNVSVAFAGFTNVLLSADFRHASTNRAALYWITNGPSPLSFDVKVSHQERNGWISDALTNPVVVLGVVPTNVGMPLIPNSSALLQVRADGRGSGVRLSLWCDDASYRWGLVDYGGWVYHRFLLGDRATPSRGYLLSCRTP